MDCLQRPLLCKHKPVCLLVCYVVFSTSPPWILLFDSILGHRLPRPSGMSCRCPSIPSASEVFLKWTPSRVHLSLHVSKLKTKRPQYASVWRYSGSSNSWQTEDGCMNTAILQNKQPCPLYWTILVPQNWNQLHIMIFFLTVVFRDGKKSCTYLDMTCFNLSPSHTFSFLMAIEHDCHNPDEAFLVVVNPLLDLDQHCIVVGERWVMGKGPDCFELFKTVMENCSSQYSGLEAQS